jgi:NADPH:quinone reductase-like Zn-dependent oxidoreductase
VGNHSLSALRRVLNPKGICVIAGAPKNPSGFVLTHMVAAPMLSCFVSQRFLTFIAIMNKEDLSIIGELMATGKVKPVIDKRYRLREAAEAIGYLEKGHARGKVVINLECSDKT